MFTSLSSVYILVLNRRVIFILYKFVQNFINHAFYVSYNYRPYEIKNGTTKNETLFNHIFR